MEGIVVLSCASGFTVKKFHNGTRTVQGAYWVELNGQPIGETERTHWHSESDANEFIKRWKKKEENMSDQDRLIIDGVKMLQKRAHSASSNAGWWNDPETGEDLTANPATAPYVFATKLFLIVSETVEAMEGIRSDKMDDKLPHRTMEETECADILIRLLDYAGKRNLDLIGATMEKMNFNADRPDHKVTNRRKAGGKKF